MIKNKKLMMVTKKGSKKTLTMTIKICKWIDDENNVEESIKLMKMMMMAKNKTRPSIRSNKEKSANTDGDRNYDDGDSAAFQRKIVSLVR